MPPTLAAAPKGSHDRPKLESGRLWVALPGILLAFLVVSVATFLAIRGAPSNYVTPDEANSIALGRAVAADPLSLLGTDTNRGLERGVVLLAALASLLTDSAVQEVRLLHVMLALCQGLIAIPVYFACRQLGLTSWQALAPGAIASTGAFAVYGAFVLNSSLGVLAFAVLLWATIRAVKSPGVAGDALVIGAGVLLAVSRMGWIPLAAATLPAIVAGSWFAGGSKRASLAERARSLPGALLRSHGLYSLTVAVSLAMLVALGPSQLLGGYGAQILQQRIEVAQVLTNGEYLVTHVAIGAALVPLMLAVPVVARDLARPPSAVSGAFAWLALGVVIVFSYAYYQSTNEDRYLAVLLPVVAVAAGLAVFQRPAPKWWAVLISAGVVAVFVRGGYFRPNTGPFDFFISPTSMFMSNAVVQRATSYVPLSGSQVAVSLLALSVLSSTAVAFLRSDRWRQTLVSRVFCAAVFTVMLAWQAAAMEYPVRKYTQTLGMTGLSQASTAFIDRIGGSGKTRPLAPGGVTPEELRVQLPQLGTFNSSLAGKWTVGVGESGREARVDERTGRVASRPGAPDLVLFRSGYVPIGFKGTEQSVPPEFPYARLTKLSVPLRARWLLLGFNEAGYLSTRAGGRLRVFPHGDRGQCLFSVLLTDPRVGVPLRYQLSSRGFARAGVLQPGQPMGIERRIAPGGPVTYRLRSGLGTLPDGSRSGAGLFDVAVRSCRGGS